MKNEKAEFNIDSQLGIYNCLSPVPSDCLKKITGGRLQGMSDIKPQWRVKRMTEVFGLCGIGWKYIIKEIKFSDVDSYGQVACLVQIDLFIRTVENSYEWSDAIPGVGGSSFITLENSGKLYLSDEAVKMATTDALSVAMKMLGVGADVYMGHGGKYDTPTEKESNSSQPVKQSQPVTDNRPWLNEKQFNNACKRIPKEKDVYIKIVKAFRISKEYKMQLDKLENGRKK